MNNIDFDYLIDALKSLPGVGKKQAERIAHFLLKQDEKFIQEFIGRLQKAKRNIKICQICNNYCTGEICDICANDSRDKTKLCIVSSQEDLQKVENTNSYTGRYYVLSGELDVKSKTPINQLNIQKLMDLLKSNKIKQVIIATN
ncbi:MAG: toprim domain-containing protein [Mycoplasmoidaceae bacterium]|nr:toprim domain-containing protein [Mycoplasmoidaceae bacterium]